MTERTDWELRLLAGHAALRMLRDIRDFGHSNGLPFAWETVPALSHPSVIVATVLSVVSNGLHRRHVA